LEHTANTSDRTVQWTRPDWPVLCQMPLSVKLSVKKLGHINQLNNTIKRITLAAAILGRATTHAVKRGVARDMAHMKKTVDGVVSAAAQLVLHHKSSSASRGPTQM
jgi:hypothetical protein